MDPHSPVIAQRFDAGTIDGRPVVLIRARQPGRTRYFVWSEGLLCELTRDDEAALRQVLALSRNLGLTQQLRARCGAAHILWSGNLCFQTARSCLVLTRDGSMKSIESPAESSALEEVLLRGASLPKTLLEGRLDAQRMRVSRALRSALDRLRRRQIAVRGDIEKMDKAIDESKYARMFVAESANAPRGTRELRTHDWETGELISLALPPGVAPRDALERIFRRAKRLKEGRTLADERIRATTLTIKSLTDCADVISRSATIDAIDAVVVEARRAAPRDFRLGDSPRPTVSVQAKALPCRLFQTARGFVLWVGRNAASNDVLLKIARPHDAWFHAKDRTGSHVIVPLERGKDCPPDALIDAAHLAAHFSDARREPVVDVQHTTKRHLRKPRGAAPGLVVVTKEKVILLRVEEARLKTLLESELSTHDLRMPPRV
jgi:predicted ribosome quality control (RQC) complex YloA/Tae2 family protein